MSAATFEQLIAAHGPTIARHNMSDHANYTTDEFINTIANIGHLYANGATSSLQDAAEHLTAAANYLTDAQHDPTNAPVLIAKADQHLDVVDALALA